MTITTSRDDLLSLLSYFHEVLDIHDGSKLSSKDLWGLPLCQGDVLSEVSSAPSSFCAFKSLRAKLKKMSGIRDVLRTVLSSLEDGVSEFETQLIPAAMSQGLRSIPDEILSVMLGYAVTDIKDTASLSLVCPRFRAVLSSSPCIWAGLTLTERMTSRQVATIVDRSGGLLLDANIDGPFDTREEAASILLLHSSLLKQLRIGHISYNMHFRERFNGLHLPHLRVLLQQHYHFASLAQTCKSWTMPLLQVLDACFIPLPMHGSNLIRCKLTFTLHFCSEGGLLDFLAFAPILEYLQMTFLRTKEWPETRSEVVTLPNLKSMTLSVHQRTSPSLLHIILSKLRTDNLSDLTVKLSEGIGYHEGLDSIVLQFISRQGSLRYLNVLFGDEASKRLLDGHRIDRLLERIYRLFTNVPSSIQTPKVDVVLCQISISWDTTREEFLVPDITSLRISDVEDLTVEDLRKSFCSILGQLPAVRRLEVVRCRNIDEAELRELFSDTEDIKFIPFEVESS